MPIKDPWQEAVAEKTVACAICGAIFDAGYPIMRNTESGRVLCPPPRHVNIWDKALKRYVPAPKAGSSLISCEENSNVACTTIHGYVDVEFRFGDGSVFVTWPHPIVLPSDRRMRVHLSGEQAERLLSDLARELGRSLSKAQTAERARGDDASIEQQAPYSGRSEQDREVSGQREEER